MEYLPFFDLCIDKPSNGFQIAGGCDIVGVDAINGHAGHIILRPFQFMNERYQAVPHRPLQVVNLNTMTQSLRNGFPLNPFDFQDSVTPLNS